MREIAASECTGCGTCAGVCPDNAIVMRKSEREGSYFPVVTMSECRACSLCEDVCPGVGIDFNWFNRSLFGHESSDVLLGNYIKCYVGHSVDEAVRANASSGGLATALLLHALEEGLIDSAIVARMRQDAPLEPEVFVARTRSELLSASKSKYCPVPANVGIRHVLRTDGRFGIVGLPCHIEGIRKAEESFPRLKKNLLFRIGIFCSRGINFYGTEFLLSKMGVSPEQVIKLDYRGLGWPGGMSVWLKDGRRIFVPFSSYYPLLSKFVFTPTRCMLCSDGTNELSDISLGDAWLSDLMKLGHGESIIITRSESGERLLKEAVLKRMVVVTEIERDRIVQTQHHMLSFKKRRLKAHVTVSKSLGARVPDTQSILLQPSFVDYVRAIPICLINRVIPRNLVPTLIRFLPATIPVRIMKFPPRLGSTFAEGHSH